MRIAVTGGNGRVGRAVTALAAAEGHEVVVIDRVDAGAAGGPAYLPVDTTDYAALLEAVDGCDALIHLAAIGAPGRFPDHVVHNNNIVSSYNALRAAVEAGITRVCQASSINALGGVFSRRPRYDYFPVDEHHPTYNEDPYSLSKWICEAQADSIARRYAHMTIASLRLHGVTPSRDHFKRRLGDSPLAAKHLWGYVLERAAARACLLGVTAGFSGHEAFYIVAPDTTSDTPSLELKATHYPDVPLAVPLAGNAGFFDCRKAAELLGWRHDEALADD